MSNSPNLRVRISADLQDIKQGLGLLRGELARVKEDAGKALPDTKNFENGLRRLKGLVGGLFAGVTAGALVKGIIGETGQAQGELAQLRAALKSTREAAGLTETELVGMAEKFAQATTHSTGEIIDAQTRLLSYSGIAANEFPRALQLAIDQSVRLGQGLTESAEAVGKALEYPAEGVASLTKQGFRFTDAQKKMLKELEKTGRLAEAQAIVMGVMEESYEGAAAAARATLPGALKALANAFRELLDGNGGRGATQLTRAINDLAAALSAPKTKAAFADLASSVLETAAAFAKWLAADGIGYIRQLAGVVAILVKNLDVLLVLLVSIGIGKGIVAIRAATAGMTLGAAATNLWTAAVVRLRAALATVGGPVTLAIAGLTAVIYLLYKRSTQAKEAAEKHTEAMRANKEMALQSKQAALEDAKAKRQQAIDTLKAASAVLQERKARLDEARAAQSRRSGRSEYLAGGVTAAAGTGVLDAQNQQDQALKQLADWQKQIADLERAIASSTEEAEDETADAAKSIAGSNALIRDSIARALAEIDRMYADHEIGITDYYQKRRKLQEQAIDAEIEQAKMQLAVAEKGDARRKIEEDIVKLQRDRAEIAAATARDEKKALDELARSIDEVYIARLENEGKLAEAVRARLEEEFRERIVQLQNEGREGEVRTIRLHIDSEVAKAQLSDFENHMSQTLARLQAKEQSISAQQQAGLMGFVESERQIKDARAEALLQLQDLRVKAAEFLATLSADSPEAQKVLDFLRQIDGETAIVASSMQRFRQDIADAAIDELTSAFMSLVDGTKSAGEALRDFVRGFALAMAQIAARALATFLVLQMLDAVYPGLGKATAALMGVGQNHDGGLAGKPGGVRRHLSPHLFGAAPRYHSGGIAGLGPNEVPAVLERGEEVLTRTDPRHRNNGGLEGGQGQQVAFRTPIVAIGDDAMADAMQSAAGEAAIVAIVRRNWEGLQRG